MVQYHMCIFRVSSNTYNTMHLFIITEHDIDGSSAKTQENFQDHYTVWNVQYQLAFSPLLFEVETHVSYAFSKFTDIRQKTLNRNTIA